MQGPGRTASSVPAAAGLGAASFGADTTASGAATLAAGAVAAGTGLMGSDEIMFVTWIAFGDAGDGGFKTHNFHKVDLR